MLLMVVVVWMMMGYCSAGLFSTVQYRVFGLVWFGFRILSSLFVGKLTAVVFGWWEIWNQHRPAPNGLWLDKIIDGRIPRHFSVITFQ
jgi:hypothetical protein